MGVPLSEIIKAIESFAPLDLAERWDNPGIQVGDPAAMIDKILISLDPTPEALTRATLSRAQLLLTHHPVSMQPFRKLDLSTLFGKFIAQAVLSGIAVYSAHTNLDRAQGGVNDILAKKLGLLDVQPLAPGHCAKKINEGHDCSGAKTGGECLGRLGRLKKPALLKEFAREAMTLLSAPGLRLVGDPESFVEIVALCGGSGISVLESAVNAGAHVLVTGDVKYHAALDSLNGDTAIIDVGHGPSEQGAVDALKDCLLRWKSESGIDLAVETYFEPDPFVFYAANAL